MAVAAYKGGVAKTTLALELAYLMDAPLIDFEWDDGSASRRWGYRHERQHGRPLLDSLTRRSTPRPVRGRRKADLVPGHPALSAAELTAAQVTEAIEKWSVEWGRDWVFVDTHPGGFPTTLGAWPQPTSSWFQRHSGRAKSTPSAACSARPAITHYSSCRPWSPGRRHPR